jgi:hypothetical protein
MWREAALLTAFVITTTTCSSAVERPVTVVSPELLAKAAREGSVRVIVHLRVPNSAQSDLRGNGMVRTREAVISEISRTRHKVVRTYETIPLLALEVSAEALEVLASSLNVERVQEDGLNSPQPKP